MKEHGPRLSLFVHLSTAFILLIKGTDKVTNNHLISGLSLLILGVTVLIIVFMERRINLSHHVAKQVCFLIESIALFIIAYVFYQEGRQYLPYAFGLCAIVYLILAIVFYFKYKGSTH